MKEKYRLGSWIVLPFSNVIQRMNEHHGGPASVRRVEPKAMQVLQCLLDRAGDVVCKQDLMDAVWTGRVVTDDVVTGAISHLLKVLSDDSRTPRYIQTVSGRGYRLVPAVDAASGAGESEPVPVRRRGKLAVAAALTVVVALAAGLFLIGGGDRDNGRVLLLPARDRSSDGDSEHLVRGLADALGSRLIRSGDIEVLAREALGGDSSMSEFLTEHSVGSVLESSLVSTEGGLELVAQLIDVTTGTYYWAARYPIREPDAATSAAWLDTIAGDLRQALTSQYVSSGPDDRQAWQDRIVVRRVPEQRFQFRRWTGSYRQTPEAIREMSTLARRHGLDEAPIMGIYPDDPDLVPAEGLS